MPVRMQDGANIPTPREETVVVQMGVTDIFDSFNPFIPNGEAITWGIHQVAREPLFFQNLMTGETVPWLATEYTYSADFTQLTIKLQPAAAWSDGTAFTAADIVFTFETLAAHENLYGNSTALETTSVEAPDPQTVVFTLAEPSPRFHTNFLAGDWSQWIRIVPKHIWEGEDPNSFAFNPPVYTGPYTLAETNPQTLQYVWQRNPNYWNNAAGFAPGYVVYTQELPVDARVQEFQRGNFDAGGLDFLNQEVVLATYDQGVQCFYPDPCPRGFMPNHARPLMSKPEARWALSLLTNRDVIANTIMQPPTTPAVYPWADYATNQVFDVPELAAEYDLTEYNPEKAGQLLDSIGATRDGDWRTFEGQELKLAMITSVPAGSAEFQIAQLLIQDATAIGLNIELVNLQGATYTDALQTGNYDIQSGWFCGTPPAMYGNYVITEGEDPVAPLGTKTEFNPERVDIQELLPLVEKIATLPGDTADDPVFAQALEVWLRHLPVVPTVQTLMSFVQNTTYWTGWPTNDDPYATPKYDLAAFMLSLARVQRASG